MATTDNGTTTGGDAADLGKALDAALAKPRRRIPRGGLVTGGIVIALVAAMGFTVLGLGVADNAVANFDASSWLWSRSKSEVARVNGLTGRVDTRVEVGQARNHAMQVTQTDRFLILRDLNTGQVSSLNLATLQIMATTRTTSGLGVSIAMLDDAAFIIDAVQGVVRQLDPRSLVPVGEPVRYPPGIAGGTFDGTGRLWIAVPSEGTVSAITPAPLPSAPAEPLPTASPLVGVANPTAGGGGGGVSPTQVKTVTVADPSHDLAVTTLDDGVAVLDRTTGALTTLRGDRQHEVKLSLSGIGAVPPRTNGAQVPVTVPEGRRVVVVGEGGQESQFAVPGEGTQLQPAVAWAGRFYCADERTGTVYVFDGRGQLVDRIEVKGANGPLELEVRESYLFINAPNSSTARVVDDKHHVRVVNKYADDVLGGDPPKDPPPPPPPPKEDVVSKPGAPRSVTATAGDKLARVSWRPADDNGSAITKYVVGGGPQPVEVGARQRSIEIAGLTNGQTYQFSVNAVNGKGAGPAKRSNPVMPTADVPDPPASVTAEARPDGTVRVTWPAANGQGNRITKYAVTSATAGATAPAGETAKTELIVPAGDLDYGTQYAFTVVAVSDKGAASTPSPASDTIVPFTVPDKPLNIAAATVNAPGTISVSWGVPPDNGRPISKYLVTVEGRTLEAAGGTTTQQVTGLPEGKTVTASVKAVNEAGESPAGTATATVIKPPTLSLVEAQPGTASAVTVTSTIYDNGSPAQCKLTISYGADSVAGGFTSCASITLAAWRAGTAYSYTFVAHNAAGDSTKTGSASTAAVNGVVTCNDGSGVYCDTGIGVYTGTRQVESESPGTSANGTRYQAWCKKTGSTISAAQYNGNKKSPWWVQITFKGAARYIPFAWLNLDNGDNINALPTCV